ncbi:N,N-dimethylformamidase beta subunit family domain-containing protein [Peribacillus alkalitolerans]|uniref:N,N-dimethylformamidase beta subunit family domain-containing protein n=1 Tax=Peribacillus alkalitolerans TaxID=1550385 RepID=UPI0013D4758F|nr:N,N-dimethylformamidase beta subunit family domain-containing protein [Peribacillus alkalitolerans]
MKKVAFLLMISMFIILLSQNYTYASENIENSEQISRLSTNSKDSQWKISKPAGKALQGYANQTSIEAGEKLVFYIHNKKPFHIEFYRMGYNEGSGSEFMQKTSRYSGILRNKQPALGATEAKWLPTVNFTVPRSWSSGVYLAKLVDTDNRQSYIPFVVKQSKPKAQLGILIAANTYQAYNNWGGKSLYGYNSTYSQAGYQASFKRPYNTGNGSGDFFAYEYNFIRWIERQNYSITYFTDKDVHDGILRKSQINAIIIPGHAEYWTMGMRKAIEEKMKNKVGLAVLNANVGYWQVRYDTKDPTKMYGYKYYDDPLALTNPSLTTTKFRNSPVNYPEQMLFGIQYAGIPEKKYNDLTITNNHWLLKGTTLKKGDRIRNIIGGEVDAYDGTIPGVEILGESFVGLYGKSTKSHVTWYKHPNGGKVFAVGTFYWNWYLDAYGKKEHNAYPNLNVQTITKNAINELIKK